MNDCSDVGRIDASSSSSPPQSSLTSSRPSSIMLSSIWSYLPSPRHHSYVCSSGPIGYHSFKEMLQNGYSIGKTILLESCDLMTVEKYDLDVCCHLMKYNGIYEGLRAASHITVYSNMRVLPRSFMAWCSGVKSIDLTMLDHRLSGYGVEWGFLSGCIGLSTIDLAPLSHLTKLSTHFLYACSGLTSIDLSPLSGLRELPDSFLRDCTGLTTIDLTPFSTSHITKIPKFMLYGCTGLQQVDLRPLITRIAGNSKKKVTVEKVVVPTCLLGGVRNREGIIIVQ